MLGWRRFPAVLVGGNLPLFWWEGISCCFSRRGFPAVLVGGDFPLF